MDEERTTHRQAIDRLEQLIDDQMRKHLQAKKEETAGIVSSGTIPFEVRWPTICALKFARDEIARHYKERVAEHDGVPPPMDGSDWMDLVDIIVYPA